MATIQSWEVSDKFWETVKPLISSPEREPKDFYKRKYSGGRKPMPHRQILKLLYMCLEPIASGKRFPKKNLAAPMPSILISCAG